MKSTSKKLLSLAAASIMLLTLITIIKPLEDPPCVFAPQTIHSVRA